MGKLKSAYPGEALAYKEGWGGLGLYGALEVFSFGAMSLASAKMLSTCTWDASTSGEDGWTHACFTAMGVHWKVDPTLLYSWNDDCGQTQYAAFHPLKTLAQYCACMRTATR